MAAEHVLFINLTKRCNMHCDRCYLSVENRKDPTLLSLEPLERVFRSSWANQVHLKLIWEGGEASLAGEEHFSRLVDHARAVLPTAAQTMVSNLYSFPDWLVHLSKDRFDAKIETTFAMDGKFSLSHDREMFLTRFAKHYHKVTQSGISCPINLELNDHTIGLGAERLVDYLVQLGDCRVEFDVSVDFETFLKNPGYTLHGYPILPLTASYASFSAFIIDFWNEIQRRGLDGQIGSSIIEEMQQSKQSSMFAVQRGSDFLTINPDGTLTTNPLFSDMQPTYLGNVLKEDVEVLLASKKRMQFIRHEIRKTVGCVSCEFYDLCSGGPSHAQTHDGSGECAGMKRLRLHFGKHP